LCAHSRFGGKAGRAAQHRKGVADAGGGARLEQCVGVEGGRVEPLGRAPYVDVAPVYAGGSAG
jgi:hypothetical protein